MSLSQMERATTAGRERERERIAERKMSELFVNWREHLADSFTNIWQPHLFVCQSPWLVLPYGADSTPWEFGCCLDRREKFETLVLSKPTLQSSICTTNKSRLCFLWKGFFSLSHSFFSQFSAVLQKPTCYVQMSNWFHKTNSKNGPRE